ncbi:MAG: NAD(+) diphosphatase [Lachnospiraceae bacterium]|nr:NAD(+) diphosphatase [Lachnospiraceae bacterium]
MIHEIYPDHYDPEYINRKAEPSNLALCCKGNRVFACYENGEIHFPTFKELSEITGEDISVLIDASWYLFSISGQAYLTTEADLSGINEYKNSEELFKASENEDKHYFLMSIHSLRELSPMLTVYAAATGVHMVSWRNSRKYCGCCGSKARPSDTERAMVCEKCGMVEYPKISPAIIVAITNGDKILLVRNKLTYYKKLALVSGFVEIGESFEDALVREVKEEVGINVKNIRYYRNQPWGMSGAQMIGYTAELDGDDTITMQESELSEASWYTRDEVPDYRHVLSVGNELIYAFKHKEYPFS